MTEQEQNIHYWQQLREGNKQALFELYNNTYFQDRKSTRLNSSHS